MMCLFFKQPPQIEYENLDLPSETYAVRLYEIVKLIYKIYESLAIHSITQHFQTKPQPIYIFHYF